MKYFWILVTDNINVLTIDDGSTASIPNFTHWPANRPFKRNNMLDALFDHVLCGLQRPDLKKTKMKRIFGMPVKSCWAVYEIDNIDLLVKNLKKIKVWWTHHAGASIEWRVRSIDKTDVKLLDVTSAAIVQDYFDKR
jgi:hypothetical protein